MRKMIDSGIEWIGDVAEGFQMLRLKNVADVLDQFRKPITADQRNQDADVLYDYYGASGVIDKIDGYTIDDHVMLIGEDGANLRMRNLPLMYEVNGKAWINNHAHILKPKENILFRYLFLTLEGLDINPYITGSAQPKLNQENLRNIWLPVPPIDVQQAIVDSLDCEYTKVDALIANVQAQIEKLKAYKQSVITEVVTKGLDPTVPMKDSGVEWIGEIPVHWDIKRGKELFQETEARSADGNEELLTVSQYTGITPRSQKNVTMFEALSLEGYKICEVGDIAANTMWLWAGAIGVSEYRGVISPSYNVYRQRSCDFVPKYLDHLLRAPMLVQEYASLSTGIRASRLRLYPKDFLNIQFPVPPIEEQQGILDSLGSEFSAADRMIAIKQAKIEKLEQYKRSLIYEYVTGKKEIAGQAIRSQVQN